MRACGGWTPTGKLANDLENEDFDEFLRRWYDQDLFAGLRRSPGYAATLARRREGHPAALAAALRVLGVGTQPPLQDGLARAEAPILLIAGGMDAKYVHHNIELVARWPSASSATLPDAGHGVLIEQPSLLAAAIADFLARQ